MWMAGLGPGRLDDRALNGVAGDIRLLVVVLDIVESVGDGEDKEGAAKGLLDANAVG